MLSAGAIPVPGKNIASSPGIESLAHEAGGSRNLVAVLAHQSVLTQFGLDASQIVSTVACDGGSSNLRFLAAIAAELGVSLRVVRNKRADRDFGSGLMI